MGIGFFIAGTDTDVGKTTISCALLDFFKQKGYKTAAYKPIAAGCDMVRGMPQSGDVIKLQRAISQKLTYAEMNYVSLKMPVSPNIAAEKEGVWLSANDSLLLDKISKLKDSVDILIVEGAGGWLTPINDQETLVDLAVAINFPVILISGMKLGCLNHTLLTVQAIQNSGLKLAGWIANCLHPDMLCQEENINYLRRKISAPLLGIIPRVDGDENDFSQYLKGLSLDIIH